VSGPVWLNWAFAALMVICALYHGGRLAAARQRGRTGGYDIDVTHLVICAVMAAMLVITFGAHLDAAWSVVVGVPALWFIVGALRALASDGARTLVQPVQQALMCVAMLFMLVVAGLSAWAPVRMATDGMAPDMAMGGHVGHDLAGSSPVVVTSLVLVVLLGLVAAQHARLLRLTVASRRTRPLPSRADLPARSGGLLLAPGLSLGGQLAMSATMIYMLVLMT
jgi:NADH:ubiquinone oxidoreductase subunit 6 (subunit J)